MLSPSWAILPVAVNLMKVGLGNVNNVPNSTFTLVLAIDRKNKIMDTSQLKCTVSKDEA